MLKYTTLVLLVFLIAACSSRTSIKSNDASANQTSHIDTTPRVTGIGGIFFKSKNPEVIKNWYGNNLGLAVDAFGSPFEFRNASNPDEKNYLRWSPFDSSSGFFAPSQKEFMINYRVYNLEGLLKKLRQGGVQILDTIETYDYGKFLHIIDPEGNKIELWEPVDSVLTNMGGKTTK